MQTQLEVQDSTYGPFKIIFYMKEVGQVPVALKDFEYQKGAYVKVFGTVRVFKEDKAIVGTYIKRITDFKEVTNHYLNAFVTSQIRK